MQNIHDEQNMKSLKKGSVLLIFPFALGTSKVWHGTVIEPVFKF